MGRVVEKTAEAKSVFIKGQGPFTMRQCVFATSCPLRGGWVGPPTVCPVPQQTEQTLVLGGPVNIC